jgi:hypothetical protein
MADAVDGMKRVLDSYRLIAPKRLAQLMPSPPMGPPDHAGEGGIARRRTSGTSQ